jgi:hypothetical protein
MIIGMFDYGVDSATIYVDQHELIFKKVTGFYSVSARDHYSVMFQWNNYDVADQLSRVLRKTITTVFFEDILDVFPNVKPVIAKVFGPQIRLSGDFCTCRPQ